MSADSFHQKVEEAMTKKGKLYDFDDFVECVNKFGTAVEMQPSEFKLFRNEGINTQHSRNFGPPPTMAT